MAGEADVMLTGGADSLSRMTWGGFHAELLVKPIRWEAGYVIPPTEPGLGVELNEAIVLAHPYEGKDLHLVPAYRPIGHPE